MDLTDLLNKKTFSNWLMQQNPTAKQTQLLNKQTHLKQSDSEKLDQVNTSK